MSNDSSEEKSQPGSDKKVRDSRKKGQAPKSQDMITALVMFSCTAYLAFSASRIATSVQGLFQEVSDALASTDMVFGETWTLLTAKGLDVLMTATFPLLIIIVFVVVIGNLLILKGFIFSVDPVKPDFKRLNPAEGFKRMFSARNVVEFLKSLFKVVALGAAFIVVYSASLPYLLGAPACGAACIFASFKYLFVPISAIAILAFFVTGLIDLLLQRWLFARDIRMSHSELKRERKDTDGSPEIRKERNRQRNTQQGSSSARGIHMASIVVGAEDDWTVGLRYRRGETKVPVVVYIAAPHAAAQVWEPGNRPAIPYIHDPALARDITRRATIGEPLPDMFFERVARILVKERLI